MIFSSVGLRIVLWPTNNSYRLHTLSLQGGGELLATTVISDVFAEDITNNKKYAFELKAPLPNSDQTKGSKEKILKLYCMEPRLVDGAYFALPYNLYKTRENYLWSFSMRWFNMQKDEVVLIGNDFWIR